jgi:DNA-binding response OmpR family regulator
VISVRSPKHGVIPLRDGNPIHRRHDETLQAQAEQMRAPARPTVSEPMVVVWCDDDTDIAGWLRALSTAGLGAWCLEPDESPVQTDTHRWPDALLFRVTGRVTRHLSSLRRLRLQWPVIPMLVLCDVGREIDHVLALELGADDVLDLSWSAPVVAARLRACCDRGRLCADAAWLAPAETVRTAGERP